MKLPNKLIGIPNADKAFHEAWYESRGLLNFPHPFRAVCLGPPNVGKTNTVKNILLRAHPPFEKVFVIHCDSAFTSEYEDISGEMLDEIPAPTEWEGKEKTLCVLDDIDTKYMQKEQKQNLDRLFGFVSTHKNISCILCAQDAFNVPPIVRRCSNLWVLWRCNDLDAMSQVARKSGLKLEDFKSIFDNLMTEKRDSLWIDMTDKSPAMLRKNGFEIIETN